MSTPMPSGLFGNSRLSDLGSINFDGATFQSLLGLVGQLSVVLWSLVLVTAVVRFVSVRIYRRINSRVAITAAAVSTPALPTPIRREQIEPADAHALDKELLGVGLLASAAARNAEFASVESGEDRLPSKVPGDVPSPSLTRRAPHIRRGATSRPPTHVTARAMISRRA